MKETIESRRAAMRAKKRVVCCKRETGVFDRLIKIESISDIRQIIGLFFTLSIIVGILWNLKYLVTIEYFPSFSGEAVFFALLSVIYIGIFAFLIFFILFYLPQMLDVQIDQCDDRGIWLLMYSCYLSIPWVVLSLISAYREEFYAEFAVLLIYGVFCIVCIIIKLLKDKKPWKQYSLNILKLTFIAIAYLLLMAFIHPSSSYRTDYYAVVLIMVLFHVFHLYLADMKRTATKNRILIPITAFFSFVLLIFIIMPVDPKYNLDDDIIFAPYIALKLGQYDAGLYVSDDAARAVVSASGEYFDFDEERDMYYTNAFILASFGDEYYFEKKFNSLRDTNNKTVRMVLPKSNVKLLVRR